MGINSRIQCKNVAKFNFKCKRNIRDRLSNSIKMIRTFNEDSDQSGHLSRLSVCSAESLFCHAPIAFPQTLLYAITVKQCRTFADHMRVTTCL